MEINGSNGEAQAEDPAQQRVKSYIVRSGKMSAKYQNAFDTFGKDYIIDVSFFKDKAAMKVYSAKSIVLEIGSGQGATLLAAAARFPEELFIGCEVYPEGVAHTIYLAQRQGLKNIKLFLGDAVDFLEAAPNNSFKEIWAFFPDPWPKRKHMKRRLITEEFLELIRKKRTGLFRAATDSLDYSKQLVRLGLKPSPRFTLRPITTFEAKALKASREIFDFQI